MPNGKPRSFSELIDDSVSEHFEKHGEAMEESLRTKVEDVQLRMLDGFFRTIQSNYAHRISALEAATQLNNETLAEIEGHSQRAESDLERLATGIRGLLGEASPK